MKLKTYRGEPLTYAHVTYKIDGIQCFLENGKVVSRKGKPLYGIDPSWLSEGEIYEVYCDGFKPTVQILRSQQGKMINKEDLYRISPLNLDIRLWIGLYPVLLKERVVELLKHAEDEGLEGLVIHAKEGSYKVKKTQTHDVPVTGIIPGRGKYIGMLGAFLTPMGRVGTGFDDDERKKYNTEEMLGEIIEVESMEITAKGKFRHARFIRHRFDK